MASALIRATSELTVHLFYEVSGVPDRPLSYTTTGAEYRPSSAEVVLYVRNPAGACPDRVKLALNRLRVYGSRVRKDGSLGADHHEEFTSYAGGPMPEWAAAMVARAIAEQTVVKSCR